MPNIFNTARYILSKQGRMSTWKLEKLCFYCQAWSLAWVTRILFDEDFFAWDSGPVCPELYEIHKDMFTISLEDIPENLEAQPGLNEDQVDTIDHVLQCYGDWEPYELRENVHEEDPWRIARGTAKFGDPPAAMISKDSMGEYYGSL